LECYAQLVGTVLSLWDAAALDAAGGEEVPPTFINLTDASMKMVSEQPRSSAQKLTLAR
jgi:CCR4-NOT transcriptional complex subunit CAF120